MRAVFDLKKITIVWMPEGKNRVKQLRFPRFFLVLFFFLLIAGLTLTSWIVRDYQKIKPRISLIFPLEKENRRQKRQTEHLIERITDTNQKLGGLQDSDFKLKIMVNLETSEQNTKYDGVGGTETDFSQFNKSMNQNDQVLARLTQPYSEDEGKEARSENLFEDGFNKFLENQKVLLFSIPTILPTRGLVTSRFGYRFSPFTGEEEFHNGVDISTKMNAPVVTPADGIVLSIHENHWSGRVVTINHGYGLVTRYAHLQKALVREGQYVKRGEPIATVGISGRSTGPHLHYEVHLNGIPANPIRYIQE